MDKAFVDILQKLVFERGKDALLDPAKSRSFLADYTQGEYRKERRLLSQALEVGAAKAIDAAPAADLALCKQQQIRSLQEECFLVPEVAADLADTLALVLRGDASRTQSAPPKAAKKTTAEMVATAQTVIGEAIAREAKAAAEAKPAKPGLTESGEYLVQTIASDTEIEITGYKGKSNKVQIPSQIEGLPVTAIGDGAFTQNQLLSVLIPNSVTHIGNGAFTSNGLESVVIPNSVTHIGIGAFAQNRLRSVVISNSVTHIEAEAFSNNYLDKVVIPDSVTYIGAMAFSDNNYNLAVSVPKGAKIEDGAFGDGVHLTKRGVK